MRRTRAIFLIAEFGFLGVLVVTFVHTPRLKGDGKKFGRFLSTLKLRRRATDFAFRGSDLRFFLISWFIVDISTKKPPCEVAII